MKVNDTKKERTAYNIAVKRLDEIIDLITEETQKDSPICIEHDKICDIIEQYENKYYSFDKMSIEESIRLKMYEMKLKQKDVAKILGVDSSRVSDYLLGKRKITMEVAKILYHDLNIDADIILQKV